MSLPVALSVLHEYGLIDETDDALVRPDPGPEPAEVDGEAPESFAARRDAWIKARDEGAADFNRRFSVASETGKWDELIAPGKQPTVFRVRAVPLTAWDAFRRVVGDLGEFEAVTLAFRMGVVRVDNLNLGIKLERRRYVDDGGNTVRALGEVLTEDVVNAMGERGLTGVVHRIGLRILSQRGALGK